MDWFNSQVLEIVIRIANALCLLFCFVKMNVDPWAAIIPLYGTWCWCERVWGYGFIAIVILLATIFIPIVGVILEMATYWMMFRRFGKGQLFCVFGVIFQPIAIAICAFDSSTYN